MALIYTQKVEMTKINELWVETCADELVIYCVTPNLQSFSIENHKIPNFFPRVRPKTGGVLSVECAHMS